MLALPLLVFSCLRLPVWEDSLSLWQDARAKRPSDALIQMQLADAVGSAGDVAGAEAAWRSAHRAPR